MQSCTEATGAASASLIELECGVDVSNALCSPTLTGKINWYYYSCIDFGVHYWVLLVLHLAIDDYLT